MGTSSDDAHTDFRFALRVEADWSVRIEIGHAFGDDDVPVLVEATRALRDVIPGQRTAPEGSPRAL